MKRLVTSTMVILLLLFCMDKPSLSKTEQHIDINVVDHSLSLMKEGELVKRYRIASGRPDSPSPVGHFKVIEKSQDWGGGFGTRWLGLNVPWGVYGIHGTNKPHLIGRSVSSGCFRMKNRDVEELYKLVDVGTPVNIMGSIHGLEDQIEVLAVGSKGTLVYLLQQRLKAAGYYHGRVNGIFNLDTEQAIEQFQHDHNLIITGHGNQRLYVELGLLE